MKVLNLPYSPYNSVEDIESYLSENYNKLNYNQFMWWRGFTPKTKPLHKRNTLKEKILNGDFDTASYKMEAELVEHRMNKIFQECHPDTPKFVEKTSLDRARRKRLLADFEKDEAEKLKALEVGFTTTFKLTKEQYEEEVVEFDGELIDFYYFIEEKYGTYWIPMKK